MVATTVLNPGFIRTRQCAHCKSQKLRSEVALRADSRYQCIAPCEAEADEPAREPVAVVPEPVKAAVVAAANGVCAHCGVKHQSVEAYRRRVERRGELAVPYWVEWFARHEVQQ